MPDIDLLGATYPDVPAVTLPSGDGTATFYHPDEIDYAASPTSGGNAVKANGILYAAVDSTSTSTKFTATVDGLTELYDGACVMLHNGVVTSAKGFTVNVNGLGAKKCYSNMTNATQESTIFNVAYTMLFVYSTALDSGNGGWWLYRGYDANTTYTPVKLGFGYGHCTTAASTAAKAVAISGYVLNTGGIVTVLFDHDVPAGATLNVTSKGAKAIYHKGAAIADGVIKAGDTATFMYSTYYHLVSIDRDDIPDGSVTTAKLADMAVTSNKLSLGAVTRNEISDSLYNELSDISYVATDATTQGVMANVGKTAVTLAPNAFANSGESDNSRTRLCWFTMANGLEVAPIGYMADLQGVLTFYARGLRTMASGTMNDESWTITALPTDVDEVSF